MSPHNAITGWSQPPITLALGQGRGDSALYRLKINGKPFYVLKQRGSFRDMAYDHGRLLAHEMEEGAFPEIVSTIARGIDYESETLRKIAGALYRCYSDRVLASVSDEYRHATEALADGYQHVLATPRFSRQHVLDAIVAIEVGNLVEGLGRLLEIPFVRVKTLIGLLPVLLPYLHDDHAQTYLKSAATSDDAQESLVRTVKHMANTNNRCDFACTGFSVPGRITKDGHHLHARNLDADLYNWNTAPVLSFVDETPSNPNWRKYVAFGTAGLIYPGGISGLNDQGIAASSHQLSTAGYRSKHESGSADIAPFVQQRILREAATLDEAVDIAKDREHFAAWVIFCSDAKSGEAVRIELHPDKVEVSRSLAEPLSQTNHFLSLDFYERQFDSGDAHFTPTFGKWLETHARFFSVKEALERCRHPRQIDTDWAIDQLASGEDYYLENVRRVKRLGAHKYASHRSYGRVPRKVYGQLSTIVRADPWRRPGTDEVWLTIGDRLPGPHATYAGWRVDWDGFNIRPTDHRPLRRTQHLVRSKRSNWEQSLERYVWARMTFSRPRDANGDLLRRDMTGDERAKAVERAEYLLGSAIELAALDRIVEVPYHHMRARMRHLRRDYAGANADWTLLRDIWARQNGDPAIGANWPVDRPRYQPLMYAYEAALVAVLSAASEDCLSVSNNWDGRRQRLDDARELLDMVKVEIFGAQMPGHFDLDRWRDVADEIEDKGGYEAKLPDPNFITVE